MRCKTLFIAAAWMLGIMALGMTKSAHADLLVIDNFAAGTNLSTLTGPDSAVNDGSHPGVLGNFRDTSAVASAGAIQVLYSPIMTNTLFFASFPGSFGTFTSLYDGFGTGSLNADLTAASKDRFAVSVVNSDADGNVSIAVTDTAGHSKTVVRPITPGATGVLDFPFANYTGVNLASVKYVQLTVASTTPGADFTLGKLTSVPEPASLSLLGLGCLALLRRSRRKRYPVS